MLYTPESITVPAHQEAGITVAAARNYVIPGLPVTPLPHPRFIPLRRVNSQTLATQLVDTASPLKPGALGTPERPMILQFGFNRWKLSGDDMAKLYSLPIASYSVSGYASPVGSKKYNLLLSEKRAKVAAKFLEMLGSKATYKGYGVPPGATCPKMVSPADCDPGLRKAVVVITRVNPGSVQMRVLPMERVSALHLAKNQFVKPILISDSWYAQLRKDSALWETLLLHPGDLRAVSAQIQKATGYTVTVVGPTMALHDIGMPWNKRVSAAVVLHTLHKQPFFLVDVNPAQKHIVIQVEIGR